MSKKRIKEVKHRVPYGVPKIPAYNNNSMKKSKSIESLIDKKIKTLQQQGINVGMCQHYLDSIIDEHISSKLNELERAHRLNINLIHSTFLRRASDKVEFQELINLIETEISATEAEFNFVESLYKNFNPLYNGKINTKGVFNEDEEMEEYKDE